MLLKRRIAVFASSLLMMGCSMQRCSSKKDVPPEDQLHAYISRAVDITRPEQRQELVDLTTGSLRAALINATDDSFKRAYIEKRYDFKNFEISERKEIEPGKRVEIIFKLVYKSWNAGESPDRIPLTSTSNRATLDYDHGQWALSNVESLNTAMDWEVGLPMGDVSTSGVSPDDAPKEVDSSRDVNEEETQQNVPLENP